MLKLKKTFEAKKRTRINQMLQDEGVEDFEWVDGTSPPSAPPPQPSNNSGKPFGLNPISFAQLQQIIRDNLKSAPVNSVGVMPDPEAKQDENGDPIEVEPPSLDEESTQLMQYAENVLNFKLYNRLKPLIKDYIGGKLLTFGTLKRFISRQTLELTETRKEDITEQEADIYLILDKSSSTEGEPAQLASLIVATLGKLGLKRYGKIQLVTFGSETRHWEFKEVKEFIKVLDDMCFDENTQTFPDAVDKVIQLMNETKKPKLVITLSDFILGDSKTGRLTQKGFEDGLIALEHLRRQDKTLLIPISVQCPFVEENWNGWGIPAVDRVGKEVFSPYLKQFGLIIPNPYNVDKQEIIRKLAGMISQRRNEMFG